MTSGEQSRQNAVLPRIFIGEDDRFENAPLYETIVTKARETGMDGATVIRGPMGYGHFSLVHTTKILRLTSGIAGTMVAARAGLHFSMLRRIVIAWLVTLPVTILIAGGLYYLFESPAMR
jgi:hypothetical protein